MNNSANSKILKILIRYLLYHLFAPHRKGFGVHSPFVFHLAGVVFRRKDDLKLLRIAAWRRELLKTDRSVHTSDEGAGSKVHISNKRLVRQIARKSSIRHKYGRILYALAQEYDPACIIELGSGIGISTVYLAMGGARGRVFSIEGDVSKLAFAADQMRDLGLKNVSLISGLFKDKLPEILKNASHPILVFVDGDHSFEATMEYFTLIKKYAEPGTIIVFDDIRWSGGMEKAWKEIKKDAETTICIDLFFMGIVFYREGIQKQEFVINF